jgi:hypothetical protein
MLGQQPRLQRRQREVRMGLNVCRQRGFLQRRQLARAVTASRAGAYLAGAATPDQRFLARIPADLNR